MYCFARTVQAIGHPQSLRTLPNLLYVNVMSDAFIRSIPNTTRHKDSTELGIVLSRKRSLDSPFLASYGMRGVGNGVFEIAQMRPQPIAVGH